MTKKNLFRLFQIDGQGAGFYTASLFAILKISFKGKL